MFIEQVNNEKSNHIKCSIFFMVLFYFKQKVNSRFSFEKFIGESHRATIFSLLWQKLLKISRIGVKKVSIFGFASTVRYCLNTKHTQNCSILFDLKRCKYEYSTNHKFLQRFSCFVLFVKKDKKISSISVCLVYWAISIPFIRQFE